MWKTQLLGNQERQLLQVVFVSVVHNSGVTCKPRIHLVSEIKAKTLGDPLLYLSFGYPRHRDAFVVSVFHIEPLFYALSSARIN
jgi:hypothetical protein